MLAPPPGYTVRHPTRADLQRVADFLVAFTIAEFGEPDSSLEDVRDEWAEIDLASDAWVVENAAAEIIAYTSVGQRGQVRTYSDGSIHPEHEGHGIGTLQVRLSEARARQITEAAPTGTRVVLNNWINGRNPRARALLERTG